MSKSLYQYRFNPEQAPLLEQALINAILSEKYVNKGTPCTYTYGSGWFTAKRRIEYKITQGILHICIWRVVAPIVPMLEMGCSDLNSFYGCALNGSMKSTIDRIAYKVHNACGLSVMTNCQTVDDNFLSRIQ